MAYMIQGTERRAQGTERGETIEVEAEGAVVARLVLVPQEDSWGVRA